MVLIIKIGWKIISKITDNTKIVDLLAHLVTDPKIMVTDLKSKKLFQDIKALSAINFKSTTF